jgi:hypothetical protein
MMLYFWVENKGCDSVPHIDKDPALSIQQRHTWSTDLVFARDLAQEFSFPKLKPTVAEETAVLKARDKCLHPISATS